MSRTVIAVYDDFETARSVIEDLVEAGFLRDNLSMVANDASGTYAGYLTAENEDVSAGEGAAFGAAVGGLLGLGAAVIPGIGPVVAAGPLAAAALAGLGAVAGAATGGIVAALVDLGVPEEDAGHFAEGIRRGGVLVTAVVDDHEAARAQEIMNRHNPVELSRRLSSWRESGYTGFHSDAPPYAAEDIEREREEYRSREIGERRRYDMPE